MNTFVMRLRVWLVCSFAGAALLLLGSAIAVAQTKIRYCDPDTGIVCADKLDNVGGVYIGHDEPSLLFYSNTPGSGNSNIYRITLPKDPPLLPQQDGSGGTWNFQLHPAFWFGMAMCDDQSAPNPGGSPGAGPNIKCVPDSDTNIYDNPNPKKKDYIGRHPGSAFMEMQFYPPGWFNFNVISPTQWTAALNIDSDSENQNTGQPNNAACGGAIEYVNFAFIQIDGIPFPPGSPSPLGPFVSTNANTLFMNPGDDLIVTLADTDHGLKVTVQDLTTGQTGFMVASAANGFAEIAFDPNGNNCDFATHNLPYDFHPMYATSSEHTRVTWTAHSYNIAFSDEIGHWEYCNTVAFEGGPCTSNPPSEPPGLDDTFCIDAAFVASFGLIPVGGCFLDADVNFDGVSYRNNTWPGSFTDPNADFLFHAQPVKFTSPMFFNNGGQLKNYNRVAFETDLPRIETNTNPPCQRHLSNPADPNPGQGCVNPPVGADFYPIYSTGFGFDGCVWQLGGPNIPLTTDTLGGTSAAQYGALTAAFYPASNGLPQYIFETFHRNLQQNPCPAGR